MEGFGLHSSGSGLGPVANSCEYCSGIRLLDEDCVQDGSLLQHKYSTLQLSSINSTQGTLEQYLSEQPVCYTFHLLDSSPVQHAFLRHAATLNSRPQDTATYPVPLSRPNSA
jgi:hypothetical protein